MKTALLATLALVSIAGAAQAQTHTPSAPPSVSVAYADLDLRQAQDAATMLKRIRRAAGEACRQSPGLVGNDADTVLRARDCYRQAVARAVAGLNAPKVTQALGGQAQGPLLAHLP